MDLAAAGEGSPVYRIPALEETTRGTVVAAYDARPTLGDLPGNIAVVVRRSSDGGRTWTAPISARRDTAPFGYGDPSFVVDRETGRTFLFHAASVRSDAHDASWRAGALVGPDADENKVVELSDGRLMLNSRAKPHRKVASSGDGGETWTGWRDEPQLVDPANNGAIIRHSPDAPPTARETHSLLFSNTEHPTDRRNVTVQLSCDDGASWPVKIAVDSGPSAYSTIARLRDGALGVLYERGPYQTIRFVRMPMPMGCEAPDNQEHSAGPAER